MNGSVPVVVVPGTVARAGVVRRECVNEVPMIAGIVTASEADRRYRLTFASSPSEHERKAGKAASAQAWLDLAAIARLALVLELPHHHELRQHWPTLTVLEQRRILSAALATLTVDGADTTAARARVHLTFVDDPTTSTRESRA